MLCLTYITSVLLRSHPGCFSSTGAARPADQDGAEGPKPPPVGAVLLQHVPGGSVVSAQRQPWTRARLSKASSWPEGGPAPGLHASGINSVFPIPRFITERCSSFQSSRSDQHLHIWLTPIATRKNNEGTFTTVLLAPVKTAPRALLLRICAHLCRCDDRNHHTLMDALTKLAGQRWCGELVVTNAIRPSAKCSECCTLLELPTPYSAAHNGWYYYDCITVIASVLHMCSCRFGSPCLVVEQHTAAKGFICWISLPWYNPNSCQNYKEMQNLVFLFWIMANPRRFYFFLTKTFWYVWPILPTELEPQKTHHCCEKHSWPGP